MTRRPVLALVAGLAVALLALTGCGSSSSSSGSAAGGSASTYDGFGLTPAQPRPSFTLTDTTGQPFSFAQATAGKPTFLYFGYTTCPDVCPTTMADIGLALQKVPAALRSQTQVVFVTTDVKTDTGPVIASWLKAFDVTGTNPFIGLYGTQAQVDQAQAAAHIFLASDGGQQHSAQVLLYGADDYARTSFLQSDNETDAMVHDLPLVAKK